MERISSQTPHWSYYYTHPGGAWGWVLLRVVGDVHMYPETRQPCSGISLIFNFFPPPLLSLRHIEPVVKSWRMRLGRSYISVGIADVFYAPTVSSISRDVLIIVAIRNMRHKTSIVNGKVS
jgi:hypothetical protein